MNRIVLIVLVSLGVLAGLVFAFREPLIRLAFAPQPPSGDVELGRALDDLPADAVQVVADGLDIPWEIAFLPDGDLLVSERPGRLLRIGERGRVFEIAGVRHVGEGGLLGLALHPNFVDTRWLYLYLTTQVEGGLRNRVERYTLSDDALTERVVLLEGIPGAPFHDGGRIAFGFDGHLYVTTGDAGNPSAAQDRGTLAGKILRLTDTGAIPPDNPLGTLVYSYGHRNPQGLAWDEAGQLWATEHGRSGLQSGFDELNRITPGANYGWPAIQGDETNEDMTAPVMHSGPDHTWAPAGAAYWAGSVLFAGLRGQALYEARLDGETPELVIHLQGDYGRLRLVRLGPDGWLYLGTSNTDGRGRPRPGDDRVVRVDPDALR